MKLYYDCPIKAAYMAKYFGVAYNFTNHHGIEIEAHIKNSKRKELETYVANLVLKYRTRRFYIHPDSLHIFEPQVGDVVKWHNLNAFDRFNFKYTEIEKGKEKPSPDNEWWIIQRNNLPFIMPEKHFTGKIT